MENTYAKQSLTEFLKVSLPIAGSAVTSLLFGMVDTLFMGHYDVNGLAAVGTGAAIFDLFISIVMACVTAHQILAPRRFGANDLYGVGTSLFNSAIYVGAVSSGLAVLLALASTAVAHRFLNSPVVVEQLSMYLRIRAPELLIQGLASIIAATLSAQKRTSWTMYQTILTNCTNILLMYGLVFGFGHWSLGVAGCAVANLSAAIVGLIFLLGVFVHFRLDRELHLSEQKFNLMEQRQIVFLTVPGVISTIVDYIANLIILALIGTLGERYLAGSRIAFNIDMTIFSIGMSLSAGIRILAGRAWGSRELLWVRRYLSTGSIVVFLALLVSGAVLLIMPYGVVALFTSFQAVRDLDLWAVRIIGLTCPFIAVACAAVSGLRMLGKTKIDMYSNIIPIWLIQVPVGWLLGVHLRMGLTGIYIGFAGYWVLRAIIALSLLLSILRVEGILFSKSPEGEIQVDGV